MLRKEDKYEELKMTFMAIKGTFKTSKCKVIRRNVRAKNGDRYSDKQIERPNIISKEKLSWQIDFLFLKQHKTRLSKITSFQDADTFFF